MTANQKRLFYITKYSSKTITYHFQTQRLVLTINTDDGLLVLASVVPTANSGCQQGDAVFDLKYILKRYEPSQQIIPLAVTGNPDSELTHWVHAA